MTRNEPFETERMAAGDGAADEPLSLSQALLLPRVAIEDTSPVIDAGLYPVKTEVGKPLTVRSTVFADGHDVLAVTLNWRQRHGRRWHSLPMQALGNDRWEAAFSIAEVGRHVFVIEAWIDGWGTYCHDLERSSPPASISPWSWKKGACTCSTPQSAATGRCASSCSPWRRACVRSGRPRRGWNC